MTIDVGNWHRALAESLPRTMDELRESITELERERADKLALLADYGELLAIARRRVPAPVTLELPRERPLAAEDVVAA